MSEVETQFFTKGQREKLQGNYPIFLREKEIVWFLERGSVNLFAIEKRGESPEGPRTLIATLAAPTALFGFSGVPNTSHEMVAITEGETHLWRIPLRDVESAIDRDPAYLEAWINHLAGFYEKEICKEPQTYIEAPLSFHIEQGETVSLKRASTHQDKSKINWLEVKEGDVMFLNFPSLLVAKEPFPLTYHAWVKSLDGAQVTAYCTTSEWKKGLSHFHQLLMDYLILHQKVGAGEKKGRIEKRRLHEEEGIRHSLEEIVSVLNPFKPEEIPGSLDPLFQACQLVGEPLKLHFQKPEPIRNQNALEIVKKIAEDSGVRYREVRLSGPWWKKDSGPILGFYGPEFKPIALLEKKPGRYEMVEPANGARTPVDQTNAGQISLVGFTFYPTFPNQVLSGKNVLQFYLKHHAGAFKSLIFYSLIAALLSLFPPFATGILLNKAIPDANMSLLSQTTAALFLAAVASSIFIFFRSLAFARLEGLSSGRIQTAMWDRLLKLPVSFFRRYSSGNLILRVMSTEWMRSLLSGNASRILFSGIFSLFYVFAMAVYAPSLTFIAVGFLLVSFLITLACSILYYRMQMKFYEWEALINSFVIQIISSVAKIRTVGAEKSAFAKWALLYAPYKKIELRSQNLRNVVKAMNYILPFLMYFALFSYVISHGISYTVGTFIAFNTAFVSFYLAMTDLSNTVLEMLPILPLWERTKVIVSEPLEEQRSPKRPGLLTGEIHVDEVSFQYEQKGPKILHHVSLKANPREFIGIVGPSGCGKSTLIRLLLGLEKPISGAIYYDNQDLASLSIHDLRKQIGVVLQDGGVIAGSIYDNLACGGNYSQEELENALEISGFADDITQFPMGLHTYLTIGGTTLSGGQKQRLLIARALLPNPKILLLDEATSALDNRNQEKVIASIDHLDVTRIVIAHRLSTIRHADRIYVMQNGEFVQTGTFEELAAQPGLFYTMLKRQELLKD